MIIKEGYVLCTLGDCEVGHIVETPLGNGRCQVVEVGERPKVMLHDGRVVQGWNETKVRRYGKVVDAG